MSVKILFIGFNHRYKDPRLYFRQMRVLKEQDPHCEIYLAKDGKLVSYDEINYIQLRTDHANKKIKKKRKIYFYIKTIEWMVSFAKEKIYKLNLIQKINYLKPDVVQASDAREIPFALLVRIVYGSKIIYDSHEDYFRQVIDYGGGSPNVYIKAFLLKIYELVGIRFFDAVFCTDESLQKKYSKSYYKAKSVNLLRNFPFIYNRRQKRGQIYTDCLSLVYIGGVNRYRGVVETAEYVNRYNKENGGDRRLEFIVYSPKNDLVENLEKKGMIKYHPWIDLDLLEEELLDYDVGICLWLDIPKFHRNLPLKNFDYMFAGLPILTSNFGNLEVYAKKSGAAICIDPEDYEAFCSAVEILFDKNTRQRLGNAGRRYVENEASFQTEASIYESVMLNR